MSDSNLIGYKDLIEHHKSHHGTEDKLRGIITAQQSRIADTEAALSDMTADRNTAAQAARVWQEKCQTAEARIAELEAELDQYDPPKQHNIPWKDSKFNPDNWTDETRAEIPHPHIVNPWKPELPDAA